MSRGAGAPISPRIFGSGTVRSAVAIAVEAPPVLATQAPVGDHRVETGAPSPPRARRRPPARPAPHGGRSPGRSGPAARTVPSACRRRAWPDPSPRADPLEQQPRRLVEVERQDAIDQEAGAVLDDHRDLAQSQREGVGGGHRLGRAVAARDHLDQRHAVHRIEEVQADHAFGTNRARGDVGDRQRGGVGGEDRALADALFGVGQNLPLDFEILHDRLDDQIAREPDRCRPASAR